MRWLALIFALLVAVPVHAQVAAGPSTAMTPAPEDRAKQWLGLVDDKNYSESYNQMGAEARDRIAVGPWTLKVSVVREPLGAMAARTIKAVKLNKTLPAMRDGQYAIVQFDSSFAHKSAAVESVTLTSEKGGRSVIGYFIN